MLIFKELSMCPREEVENVKNGICLSDEEIIVFDMLVYKQASYQQIADKIYKSDRTVIRIANRIKDKVIGYMSR